MTETEESPAYVRKAQLAKILSVSPRTIDTWIARRMIPVIAPIGLGEKGETYNINADTCPLSLMNTVSSFISVWTNALGMSSTHTS